jgi:hypothetical protein
LTAFIVNGSLVEISSSVVLCLNWGWELSDDHFNKGISSVDPFLEDAFEEVFALLLSFLWLKDNLQVSEHLENGLLVVIHDVLAESDDWFHDELNEASLKLGAIFGNLFCCPFLIFGIKEVVSPKLLHHLIKVHFEFLGIDSCESGKCKGPTEKSRTEGNCSLAGINLLRFSHIIAFVSGNDDISIFYNSLEVLEHVFTFDLELKDSSVDLVNE